MTGAVPTQSETVLAAWQTLCWLYAIGGLVVGWFLRGVGEWLMDYMQDAA